LLLHSEEEAQVEAVAGIQRRSQGHRSRRQAAVEAASVCLGWRLLERRAAHGDESASAQGNEDCVRRSRSQIRRAIRRRERGHVDEADTQAIDRRARRVGNAPSNIDGAERRVVGRV
jgi:hypothetical protein